jgi:hypothetical protein
MNRCNCYRVAARHCLHDVTEDLGHIRRERSRQCCSRSTLQVRRFGRECVVLGSASGRDRIAMSASSDSVGGPLRDRGYRPLRIDVGSASTTAAHRRRRTEDAGAYLAPLRGCSRDHSRGCSRCPSAA